MSVDELDEAGLSRMDGDAIDRFLANQRTGVLALPAEGAPYVVPLSFGYDGEGSLYFTYLLGSESRKEALTERAETASFLVYSADSPFHWQSVLVEGRLDRLPREQWDDAPLDEAWRPALFESATLSRGAAVYRLRVEELAGLRHAGLPPGFDR